MADVTLAELSADPWKQCFYCQSRRWINDTGRIRCATPSRTITIWSVPAEIKVGQSPDRINQYPANFDPASKRDFCEKFNNPEVR